ncbi:MAG: GatB/YqeY domain-containing protein [Candidatus Sulfobium sp.]
MEFLEKISKDLAVTMKGRGEDRELVISVLRMIKSTVKNAEIASRSTGKDLSDEDIIGVLSSMVKQRKESAGQYLSANRKDLADRENREIDIIQKYLPRQLTPEELDSIIRSAVEETGVRAARIFLSPGRFSLPVPKRISAKGRYQLTGLPAPGGAEDDRVSRGDILRGRNAISRFPERLDGVKEHLIIIPPAISFLDPSHHLNSITCQSI